ncbi:DNA repair protein RecO [Prochlorococcus marinus str. MU1404]|uniref:DNA repair protein RecO n=1 Tax=Prochlorococcus marinus TaxID=1219 RepID=UPI001ADAAE40|nr:DNA repair protein RecO [Prochlorococcus marinus]MBO8229597.1 DNA repair protein RecO [Prochlorococcus marinus XMU1404]MBW3072674.1 DNA repair protein RecO [Prochlorococcus marinus str. MU1404]MCR8546068.1 DNA repair protein RecO [Prochlorococcus marinus CUG1432]
MSGSGEFRLEGLCIKATPLGENDRIITILTDEQGIVRLAVPGARRPKSSLAAATPLTYLSLQIFGKRNLKSVRQIKILKSYSGLGKNIECLAAAQAITELTFLLIGNNDQQQNYLTCVLAHLDRIYLYEVSKEEDFKILSISMQSLIHLLAIGGINLPIHHCCKTGAPIIPPLGNWKWNCYYLPSEGFSTIEDPQSNLKINASEVALIQRLLFPELPIKSNGELLGPKKVWLKILFIIETWISTQLEKDISSLKMLKELYS